MSDELAACAKLPNLATTPAANAPFRKSLRSLIPPPLVLRICAARHIIGWRDLKPGRLGKSRIVEGGRLHARVRRAHQGEFLRSIPNFASGGLWEPTRIPNFSDRDLHCLAPPNIQLGTAVVC